MRWDAVQAEPDRIALARDLVEQVPTSGWSRSTLAAASVGALADPDAWRRVFPRGARDAIWFVSLVSDASMQRVFEAGRARAMSTVILERLAQNRDLKPFVRRVMLFDLAHPIQALARMDRTARVMFNCVLPAAPPSRAALTALNLAYTAIVFAWLFDRSAGDRVTGRLTPRVMRLIGLS